MDPYYGATQEIMGHMGQSWPQSQLELGMTPEDLIDFDRRQRRADVMLQRYNAQWTIGRFLFRHKAKIGPALAFTMIPGIGKAFHAYDQAAAGHNKELTHKAAGGDSNFARSQYLSGSSDSRSFRSALDAQREVNRIFATSPSPMSGTKRSQTREANAARKIQRMCSGTSSKNTRTRTGLKPAMFRPGRGAEIPYVRDNYSQPIKMAPGLKGARTLNKYEVAKAQSDILSGQEVSMSFAYTVTLDVSPSKFDVPFTQVNALNPPQSARLLRPTRFWCTNIFRHSDSNQFAPQSAANGMPTPVAVPLKQAFWHQTLGPDLGYIRQSPPIGPWYNPSPDPLLPATPLPGNPPPSIIQQNAPGLNVSLQSPFRTPIVGQEMSSRLYMQQLENISWNLNPLKFKAPLTGTAETSLTTTEVQVYENSEMQTFPAGAPFLRSLPSLQPTLTGSGSNCSGIYKVQFGSGALKYQFSNNATSPCVVDVVWVKFKTGKANVAAPGFDNTASQVIMRAFGQGYVTQNTANMGVCQMDGKIPVVADVATNADCEFMPSSALKYVNVAFGSDVADTSGPGIPWKVVCRDQFIVQGGAVRPWSTHLPSLNYDARNYARLNNNYHDQTVMLFFGFSGVSAAQGESAINNPYKTITAPTPWSDDLQIPSIGTNYWPVSPSDTIGAGAPTKWSNSVKIIDRSATDVDMSVTGVYLERPKPAYLTEFVNKYYIRGVLNDVAYYPNTNYQTTATTWPTDGTLMPPYQYTSDMLLVNQVPEGQSHVNISTEANTVRNQAQQSAYANVGAASTQT